MNTDSPAPAPQYQAPPPDPALAALTQQSASANIAAVQNQAGMDTARLAMLYGQMGVAGLR